jgi:hypothetical protein
MISSRTLRDGVDMIGVIIGGGVLFALLTLLHLADRRAKRAGHTVRTDVDISYDGLAPRGDDPTVAHSTGPDMKNRQRSHHDEQAKAPKRRGVIQLKSRRD